MPDQMPIASLRGDSLEFQPVWDMRSWTRKRYRRTNMQLSRDSFNILAPITALLVLVTALSRFLLSTTWTQTLLLIAFASAAVSTTAFVLSQNREEIIRIRRHFVPVAFLGVANFVLVSLLQSLPGTNQARLEIAGFFTALFNTLSMATTIFFYVFPLHIHLSRLAELDRQFEYFERTGLSISGSSISSEESTSYWEDEEPIARMLAKYYSSYHRVRAFSWPIVIAGPLAMSISALITSFR